MTIFRLSFSPGHTDIAQRKYWNLIGNTDKTRHKKDHLLKCNFSSRSYYHFLLFKVWIPEYNHCFVNFIFVKCLKWSSFSQEIRKPKRKWRPAYYTTILFGILSFQTYKQIHRSTYIEMVRLIISQISEIIINKIVVFTTNYRCVHEGQGAITFLKAQWWPPCL